jgi:hypothetical protein
VRGGIVTVLATPPSFAATPSASLWSNAANLSSTALPTYLPSLPALRIENNTVRVPLGETLEAAGFGAFSIQNNHFSCGGTVTLNGRPLATTVLILNLGTAIESAVGKFSSLHGINAAGTFSSVGQPTPAIPATGSVLFTGNVCQLESTASKQQAFASVVVLTLDHLTFANNHCWLDGPPITAFVDGLLVGATLQVTSNRFQEAAGFPVLASGITIGRINIASQNLSTYCLFNVGTAKLVDVNNVAMIDLAAQDFCAGLAKSLNL